MIDYSFTYRDDNFSAERTNEASLLIIAGKNELSFLITENGRIVGWKDSVPASELGTGSPTQQLLSLNFRDTKLGIIPDALTLVPAPLFNNDSAPAYARYLDINGNDKVFSTQLDADNYVVYKTNSDALTELGNQFDLHQTVLADKGWLQNISKNGPTSDQLYINLFDEHLTVANFRHSRIYLYNTFEAKDINDVTYYTMFVAGQLQLAANDVNLVISGNINDGDRDFSQLTQFFKSVKVSDIKLLDIPAQIKPHQVLSLSSLV